jgi:photosystem II stability/assembly factor-like uncharacterized protein
MTPSIAAHTSGTLFVFDPPSRTVKFSTDKGRSWRPLMGLHPAGRLAAANANSTWLVTDQDLRYVSDGQFMFWSVTDPGEFSVAEGKMWLIQGGKVSASTPSIPSAYISPLPAPAIHIAALSAEAAMVMTLSDGDVANWYYTNDAGANWTPRPDPCAATSTSSNVLASNRFTTMFSAPDRSLWMVCASEPGAGQQPKELLVSTNDGETWQSRGKLEISGYGTAVCPVSKTVAWRSGGRADLYRTTDGTHWKTVTADEDGSGFEVAALDQDTAIRLLHEAAYLTTDGGRTWKPISF